VLTMSRIQTREKLIEIGSNVIYEQGFNHTGINEILSQAGVPKGSFYHYFSSKQDFGMAIIDNFSQNYAVLLQGFLQDEAFSPLQRMRNYLNNCMETLIENDFNQGCMIGNLSQEMATQNSIFREKLASIFAEWKKQYEACFQSAIEAGELAEHENCEQLAEFLLLASQGAILRAKVRKSPIPMQNFIDTLFMRILKQE